MNRIKTHDDLGALECVYAILAFILIGAAGSICDYLCTVVGL